MSDSIPHLPALRLGRTYESLEKIEVKDVDIRNYAKYVLKESSNLEKRELLSCLKSKILLANKMVSVL